MKKLINILKDPWVYLAFALVSLTAVGYYQKYQEKQNTEEKVQTDATYDNSGRIIKLSSETKNSIISYSYEYDTMDRIIKQKLTQTNKGNNRTEFDATNFFEYDSVGNRKIKLFISSEYDNKGNKIKEIWDKEDNNTIDTIINYQKEELK